MSYSALFLLIVALAIAGYWLGKYRALAQVGGGKGIRRLHSLPSYHGLRAALWIALPCVLLLVIWGMGQETLITSVVKRHLPDQQLAADGTQVGLFMNDVHNVLSGAIPAEGASEGVQAAAAEYQQLRSVGARARTALVLILCAGGFWLARRGIKPELRARNVVEITVVGLAERGVRSSIVRLPLIAHDTTDTAGFLPQLIALAKDKGFAGYPGDGANAWSAVHIRDVASLFRLALEKGPAGRYWHAVQDEGISFREIAEAIGSRLDLPVVSVPVDELMVPGYFGALASLVTKNYPAANLITRQTLGWEPTQPALMADLDNGHYFAAS